MKKLISTLCFLSVALIIRAQAPSYLNTELPFGDRVSDLVSRMTKSGRSKEKAPQTCLCVNYRPVLQIPGRLPLQWFDFN